MNNASHLKAPARKKLAQALDAPICGGNKKVAKLGIAISEISGLMSDAGYSLDMVCADILMGDSGNRQLPFRVLNKTPDPFFEHPQIENSYINFTWENLAHDGAVKSFEVIAYVS